MTNVVGLPDYCRIIVISATGLQTVDGEEKDGGGEFEGVIRAVLTCVPARQLRALSQYGHIILYAKEGTYRAIGSFFYRALLSSDF